MFVKVWPYSVAKIRLINPSRYAFESDFDSRKVLITPCLNSVKLALIVHIDLQVRSFH